MGRKKQHTMTFRMRGDLRDRLVAAAEQSGRSLSEEIERRVDLSFERPEPFADFVAAFARFVEAERAEPHPDLAEIGEAAVLEAVDARINGGGGR